jgi:hypothetical protein
MTGSEYQFVMQSLPSDSGFGLTVQSILGFSANRSKGNETYEYDCSSDLAWGYRGYGAAQCTVELCIKTYNSFIDHGQLVETEIDSHPGISTNFDVWSNNNETMSTLDMACLNITDKTALQAAGYHFDNNTAWLEYKQTTRLG